MEEEKLKKGLDKIYDLLNVACGNCIIEDNERESLQHVICYIEKRYEQDEKVIKEMAKHIERFSAADFHNYGANADEWEMYFRKKCE